MRPQLEFGPHRPRQDARRVTQGRRRYQAPRLLEFDEELRRRCAQVFEDLCHLLHALKCEDVEHPARIERPRAVFRRYDPHYWG